MYADNFAIEFYNKKEADLFDIQSENELKGRFCSELHKIPLIEMDIDDILYSLNENNLFRREYQPTTRIIFGVYARQKDHLFQI